MKESKKRYYQISYLRKFIKYKYVIRLLHFGTLVSALCFYCRDVKYGLLSKHLFQRKQQYGKNMKKTQSNGTFLSF